MTGFDSAQPALFFLETKSFHEQSEFAERIRRLLSGVEITIYPTKTLTHTFQ